MFETHGYVKREKLQIFTVTTIMTKRVLYLLAVTFEYAAKLTVFHSCKFSGRLKGGNVKHISEHLATPTKDELMAFVTYSIQAYGFDIDLAEKPFTNFDGDEHL